MTKKILCLLLSVILTATVGGSFVFAEDIGLPMPGDQALLEEMPQREELESEDAVHELEEIGETVTDRFIVKFKDNTHVSLEAAAESAYTSAKEAKNQAISRVLEVKGISLENVYREESKSNMDNRRLKDVLSDIDTSEPALFALDRNASSIQSAEFTALQEDKQVISLPEKVDPDVFVEEVQASLGEEIEYIQPDYELELAADDEESISLEIVPIGPSGESVETDLEIEVGSAPNAEPSEESQTTAAPVATEEPETTSAPDTSPSPEPENPVAIPTATPTEAPERVIVAVIDTGIDVTHPDLEEHVVDGYNFVNDSDQVYDAELGMEQAHGTHVAGIIAQTAPDAKIMPLKCFENGRAYTSDLIEAINFAKENGASIVNCSWGSKDNNQALREAMEQSGLFFVCAAGNNRMDVDETPIYPASFGLDNSISVTSLNQDYGFSYYSNYGMSIDIAAIGREVESAFPGGERGAMNGTSMSAGFISGAAAIATASGETDLKTRIISTGDRLSNLQNKLKDGRALNLEHLISNTQSDEILDCTPADDFDVHGYERTPEENWALFGTSKTTDISAGYNHVLALKEDGTVWSWGNNGNGQLGDGSDLAHNYPKQVPGLTEIEKIFCGFYNSFAINRSGEVYVWGFNGYHQLGDGTNISKRVPTQIPLTNIVSIASGDDHSMFLSINGEVYTCGYNDMGQLGTGDLHPSATPVLISELKNIVAIGAGNLFSVALNSYGIVYAWGENDAAKICGLNVHYIPSPWQVPGLSNVRSISSRHWHTLALQTDGTVWSWGGGTEDHNSTGYAIPKKIIGLNSVEFISAGYSHNAAITSTGDLYVWGSNSNGEFGNDSSIGSETPVMITGSVKLASFGDRFSIICKKNGELYSCGKNDDGQLGLGDNSDRYLYIQITNFMMPTTLMDEQYNTSDNPAYHADQTKLESMGWKEGYYYGKGEFSAESGKLIIKKTSPQESGSELIYDVTKNFTARSDNWNNDSRVSVWTQNFKGDYEIKLKSSFNQPSSQVYYDIVGCDSTGNDAVLGRYRVDPGTNGDFSVYNGNLNKPGTTTYPLWKNPQQSRTISTVTNFEDATFQTFVDGSETPSKTTIDGAVPDDTFSMTDWSQRTGSTYIKGIRFSAQTQAPVNSEIARIDSLQFIEHRAEHDIVDDAISVMDMSIVTDTPEAVVSDLKELPASLAGANITWTSSHPTIIANAGTLVGKPAFATDVTMTAKITNPTDQYTKYMDFKLTVPIQAGFEETYTGTFTGTPSSTGTDGTKTFEQLPMWEFSYPGISNGTNGEVHTAQVLKKDNYLVFKKISDRQTANYKECLVGLRSLSGTDPNPSLASATVGVTAKVAGTGTMRFSPLTTEGNPVCTLILDASTKHIEVTYGEMQSGVLIKKEQRIDNIDPTTDHDYVLDLKQDHTFSIYIDGKLILTEQNNAMRQFLPEAGETPVLSKLKTWITNVTYANTEVGNLKRLSVYNAVEYEEPGPQVALSVMTGQEYVLYLRGQNIRDFVETYVITYDQSILEVTDLIGQSYPKEIEMGAEFDGVHIIAYTPGRIEIKLDQIVAVGQTYSGFINAVKFKGLSTGDSTINLIQ